MPKFLSTDENARADLTDDQIVDKMKFNESISGFRFYSCF